MTEVRVYVNDERVEHRWDYKGLETTYDPSIIEVIDELVKSLEESADNVLCVYKEEFNAEILLVKIKF